MAPVKVALRMHQGVFKMVKVLWQTHASLSPTSKRAEKYYMPARGYGYMYSYPPPGSLVVTTANERDRQDQASATQKNKAKCLDSLMVERFILL